MSEITSELLAKMCPGTAKRLRDRFLPFFNEALPRYGITNARRVAAFLTTCIFESDYLRATEEYASGWAYDISRNPGKARKLGNTERGDGPRYKGRTLIQTTGKKNYRRLTEVFGKANGIDFVKDPEKLAELKWAVEGACVYWQDNELNRLADRGKFYAIQGLVNRGSAEKRAKDYDGRLAIYDKALHLLPDDFDLGAESAAAAASTGQENDANPGAGGSTPDPEPIAGPADPQEQEQPPTPTEPRPSLWDRVTERFDGWGSKADKIEGYTSRIPMSITSKLNVLGLKLMGFVLGLWGVLVDHPIYAALGTALIIAGAWYLTRSKDRNTTAAPQQAQAVVVKT